MITTHYIEEAGAAYKVGLMRDGRLLAESRPEELLQQFNTNSYETVFLNLCQNDSQQDPLENELKINNHSSHDVKLSRWPLCERYLDSHHNLINFNFMRFFAFVKKNLYQMKGSPLVILLFLLFPSLQLSLFCVSIGKEVRSVPVAVFSAEKPAFLSRTFLRSLDRKLMTPIKHNSLESALESVQKGKTWGSISLASNFSESIKLLLTKPNDGVNAFLNVFKYFLNVF